MCALAKICLDARLLNRQVDLFFKLPGLCETKELLACVVKWVLKIAHMRLIKNSQLWGKQKVLKMLAKQGNSRGVVMVQACKVKQSSFYWSLSIASDVSFFQGRRMEFQAFRVEKWVDVCGTFSAGLKGCHNHAITAVWLLTGCLNNYSIWNKAGIS